MTTVAFAYLNPATHDSAIQLAKSLHLPIAPINSTDYPFLLVLTDERLELRATQKKAPHPIYVDFLGTKVAHRRKQKGHERIARAVGLSTSETLSILDLTAGLGQDALILANLGASVTLLERNPLIAALLKDGIARAKTADWFRALSFTFIETDAQSYLQQLKKFPDVIYFDPMHPERVKSALVKKEMRFLRDIVGDDHDAPNILALALKCALKRVVVKRPRLAPPITGPKPNFCYTGSRIRFDVYTSS